MTPAPMTPVAAAPDLPSMARIAVDLYYERHSYTAGDNLLGVAALYPSVFAKREGETTRDQHVAELGLFYAKYASFTFQVVPGTLDTSGCETLGNCLVRGTTQVSFRKLGEAGERIGRSRFSLRFDLRRGGKVLYECAVVQLKVIRETPCE